jgi:hypothetical protein
MTELSRRASTYARRAGLRGVVGSIGKTPLASTWRARTLSIPARKGADEPLAAQQEENRSNVGSNVESADHHGPEHYQKRRTE